MEVNQNNSNTEQVKETTMEQANIEKDKAKTDTKKIKKRKIRTYIVLLFIALVAIVGYIIYRGEYLEILEIGEQYTSIFWQNVNY